MSQYLFYCYYVLNKISCVLQRIFRTAIITLTMQSKHHTKECEITRSIGLDEAQCNLGLVVEEAFYGRNTFVVTHSDCEMAAIVSIEEYRKWQQLAKQTALQMVRNVWEVNKDVPEVELEADVEKAMEMLRSDNMAQASIALRL